MIRLEKISKTYYQGKTEVHALREVSLDLQPSTLTVIHGKSGSGKSTLLKVLALLERPDAGGYELDGEDMLRLSDRRAADLRNRKIALITQSPTLLEASDVNFNVLLPFYIRRERVTAQVREEVGACLQELGIAHYARTRVSQLSGGERQRVCIARAIVSGADYILADEPTGALDSETGRDLLDLLCRLRDMGRSVLMVTHDLDLARYGERRYEMCDGQLSAYTE